MKVNVWLDMDLFGDDEDCMTVKEDCMTVKEVSVKPEEEEVLIATCDVERLPIGQEYRRKDESTISVDDIIFMADSSGLVKVLSVELAKGVE